MSGRAFEYDCNMYILLRPTAMLYTLILSPMRFLTSSALLVPEQRHAPFYQPQMQKKYKKKANTVNK